jgi:hypothetical protein
LALGAVLYTAVPLRERGPDPPALRHCNAIGTSAFQKVTFGVVMPATGLHGPHNLTADGVAAAVRGVGPGAYVLGTLKTDGVFYVSYVGRSDSDLAARLLDHVAKPYPHFKYGFYGTALRSVPQRMSALSRFRADT